MRQLRFMFAISFLLFSVTCLAERTMQLHVYENAYTFTLPNDYCIASKKISPAELAKMQLQFQLKVGDHLLDLAYNCNNPDEYIQITGGGQNRLVQTKQMPVPTPKYFVSHFKKIIIEHEKKALAEPKQKNSRYKQSKLLGSDDICVYQTAPVKVDGTPTHYIIATCLLDKYSFHFTYYLAPNSPRTPQQQQFLAKFIHTYKVNT